MGLPSKRAETLPSAETVFRKRIGVHTHKADFMKDRNCQFFGQHKAGDRHFIPERKTRHLPLEFCYIYCYTATTSPFSNKRVNHGANNPSRYLVCSRVVFHDETSD
jgi:hypothetical protein